MELSSLIQIFLEIFSAVVVKDYLDNLFSRRKFKKPIIFLVWILYISLQVILSSSSLPAWNNILINYTLLICMCLILYNGKIAKILLAILIFCLLWMGVEIITGYILMMGLPERDISLFGSFISKLGMYICVQLLNICTKERDIYKVHKLADWVNAVIIPVCSIFIIHSLFTLSYDSETTDMVLALISSVIILVLNISSMKIYNKLGQDLIDIKEKMAYERQLDLCNQRVTEIENSFINFRNTSHDIKYHLLNIRQLANESHMNNEISTYIDKLLKNVMINVGISKSGNLAIDTLVDYKFNLALQKNIPFYVNIDPLDKLDFEYGDLCVIIGNILDNAIEASEKLPSKEAYIDLNIQHKKELLSISIKNKYKGKLTKNNRQFFATSKSDKELHGIGLRSVKRIVDKYNGEMLIDLPDNIFILKILLYTSK